MQKLSGARREPGVDVIQWSRLWVRAALTIGLAGSFCWLLAVRLGELDFGAVHLALSDVHILQWSAAGLATAVSFWAVGHYDAVVHRHFATGVPDGIARRAGVCAIAVSQMLGLGVITGAILRWRMLPGRSLVLATRLTVAVALSFLAGWAVVTSVVLLVLPDAPFKLIAAVVLAVTITVIALVIAAPRVTAGWPNLLSISRLVTLAAIDTLAAGVALYLLLPADMALSLAVLMPAFLIAQGAGLVSGTPGGVGAFEVTLLALLPSLPEEPLLAAVLVWRIIYYAIPAMLGGVVAMIGPKSITSTQVLTDDPVDFPRAEANIVAQGEHQVLIGSGLLCGKTPHLLVGLFDPVHGTSRCLDGLGAAAKSAARLPVLYKISGRMAAVARKAGWQTMAVAREAWTDPREFRLAASSRSGLRRKLRRAEAAGVEVCRADLLPMREMTAIARVWATSHGGERGFSMGRFAPAYVIGQRVYVARQYGRLVAFITLHQSRTEWTLDLMRHAPDLPDGTMHALVCAAIADAVAMDLPRLSLAAVPEAAFGRNTMMDAMLRRFGCDGHGLLRFKQTFAPRWQPLYVAAPGRGALALACFEIARAIAFPTPLPQTEQDHAEFEFASASGPWHRRVN
ncbi:MAG: phosphatidylglycerol lysyltransferase domain-containing protein [Paracoccaceae bacterium]